MGAWSLPKGIGSDPDAVVAGGCNLVIRDGSLLRQPFGAASGTALAAGLMAALAQTLLSLDLTHHKNGTPCIRGPLLAAKNPVQICH